MIKRVKEEVHKDKEEYQITSFMDRIGGVWFLDCRDEIRVV